jgi:hypothetical protein
MPSRIATFLIDSGFRPVAIAASSKFGLARQFNQKALFRKRPT